MFHVAVGQRCRDLRDTTCRRSSTTLGVCFWLLESGRFCQRWLLVERCGKMGDLAVPIVFILFLECSRRDHLTLPVRMEPLVFRFLRDLLLMRCLPFAARVSVECAPQQARLSFTSLHLWYYCAIVKGLRALNACLTSEIPSWEFLPAATSMSVDLEAYDERLRISFTEDITQGQDPGCQFCNGCLEAVHVNFVLHARQWSEEQCSLARHSRGMLVQRTSLILVAYRQQR